MIFAPIAKSSEQLSREELSKDIKERKKYGGCSLGQKVLYLNFWEIDNCRYIPLSAINRVYKRLAVSKGFYQGTTFGTLAFLVVEYDDSKEIVIRFKKEEDVNKLLLEIKNKTNIAVGKNK